MGTPSEGPRRHRRSLSRRRMARTNNPASGHCARRAPKKEARGRSKGKQRRKNDAKKQARRAKRGKADGQRTSTAARKVSNPQPKARSDNHIYEPPADLVRERAASE